MNDISHLTKQRLNTFAVVMNDWYNPEWTNTRETTYTCSHCQEYTTFKNPAIYAAYKKGRRISCKKCATPEDFWRHSLGVIGCSMCILKYSDEGVKAGTPFKCLCMLKHKRGLWALAAKVAEGNPNIIFQRNQKPFPNNARKCELKAIDRESGRVVWIDTLVKIMPQDREFSQLFEAPATYLPVVRKELEDPSDLYSRVKELFE